MALQQSTSNVGGDTFKDNSEKKKKSTYRILVTQNLSVVSEWSCSFQVHKIKQFQWSHFLKLQSNPISARLALTCGCMANGSHAVRMDPLF